MSGIYSDTPNYGGKQPSNSTNIKQFVPGSEGTVPLVLQRTSQALYITPLNVKNDFLLKKNLVVYGTVTTSGVISPSDIILKENIENISTEFSKNIVNLTPKKYNYKSDIAKTPYYGLLAQDLELYYPDLVITKHEGDETTKSVNYIGLIPLLIAKIQDLQNQLDRLK